MSLRLDEDQVSSFTDIDSILSHVWKLLVLGYPRMALAGTTEPHDLSPSSLLTGLIYIATGYGSKRVKRGTRSLES